MAQATRRAGSAFERTTRELEIHEALRALERLLSRASVDPANRGVLEAARAVLQRDGSR